MSVLAEDLKSLGIKGAPKSVDYRKKGTFQLNVPQDASALGLV